MTKMGQKRYILERVSVIVKFIGIIIVIILL